MKFCTKCGEYKRAAEYYKHKKSRDGRLHECITCVKARVRKHRRENDSVREYDRWRYHENPHVRARISANAKKWRENNPDRYKAHTALNNAIRDGKMKRARNANTAERVTSQSRRTTPTTKTHLPSTGSVCDATASIIMENHHENYARNLRITTRA